MTTSAEDQRAALGEDRTICDRAQKARRIGDQSHYGISKLALGKYLLGKEARFAMAALRELNDGHEVLLATGYSGWTRYARVQTLTVLTDLDMFEEVRLAAFVAKAVTNDPTSLPAPRAVLMATRLGPQALHLGHLTGSVETGKRADLILVDISPIHNSPSFKRSPDNAYAQIVYASKSTDVSDVMVNGKWLMRDHQLLTLKEDELLVQAAQMLLGVLAQVRQRRLGARFGHRHALRIIGCGRRASAQDAPTAPRSN